MNFWCSGVPRDDGKKVEATIHFNLWDIPLQKKEGRKHILDFGVKVFITENITAVNLFLPFKLASDSVTDLGKIITKTSILVSALFNEDYLVEDAGNKHIKVANKNNPKDHFFVYHLDVDQDIKIVKDFSGTIISIPAEQARKDQFNYYRIRVSLPENSPFVNTHRPENSMVESAFHETDIIDFRINDLRSTNPSLVEYLEKNSLPTESITAHFILIRNALQEHLHSSVPPKSSRLIEEHIWREYINPARSFNSLIAYHWKSIPSNSNGEFTLLVKFRYNKTSAKKVFKYCCYIVLLAILANIAYDVGKNYALKWTSASGPTPSVKPHQDDAHEK